MLELAAPRRALPCPGPTDPVLSHPVDQVNSFAPSWKAGLNNRFRGLSLAEVKSLMGALPEPSEMKADPKTDYPEVGKIPKNFDAR